MKHLAHGKAQDMVSIRIHSRCVTLYDLFYFLEDLDIASYADDTTIFTVKENKESLIGALETSSLLF